MSESYNRRQTMAALLGLASSAAVASDPATRPRSPKPSASLGPLVPLGGSVRFAKSDLVAYLARQRVEAIG